MLIIAVVSGGLLLAAGLVSRSGVDRDAVARYHAEMVAASTRVPLDFGAWSGREIELPESATKLLRLNSYVARQYTDSTDGVSASLLLIQCADIRDMEGHYPPNCYPAHGWTETVVEGVEPFGGLEAIRYRFTRRRGGEDQSQTIYSVFLLPSGETTTSMDQVRRVGADYKIRPFGAAQVQIVFSNDYTDAQYERVLASMYEIARPMIETLLAGPDVAPEGETP